MLNIFFLFFPFEEILTNKQKTYEGFVMLCFQVLFIYFTHVYVGKRGCKFLKAVPEMCQKMLFEKSN